MNTENRILLMQIEHRVCNLQRGLIHIQSLIHNSEREETQISLLKLNDKITQEVQELIQAAATLRQYLPIHTLKIR